MSPIDSELLPSLPKFSLIIATRGRSDELHRLFASLADGTSSVQCIVVDQNEDGRLEPIVEHWQSSLSIVHLKSATRGLSAARNFGSLHAIGEILAFPDDDCWYSSSLLARVTEFFARHPRYSMLSAGVRDEKNVSSGNRWVRSACDLTPTNLFRTSVGLALFLRRQDIPASIYFDETLGAGADTAFGSGEDTDYVFRLLSAGLIGRFDRAYTVHHPRRDMLSGHTTSKRAFSYGCGMGRVIRQRAQTPLLPAFLAFDFLRMVASLLRGQRGLAALCAAHSRGIFSGYMAP